MKEELGARLASEPAAGTWEQLYRGERSPPMNRFSSDPPAVRLLKVLAAFVIVVAGVRAAAPLFVPLLLALFLATLCLPSLSWLRKKGIPTTPGILIITSAIVFVCFVLVDLLSSTLSQFQADRLTYSASLNRMTDTVVAWLQEHHFDVSLQTVRDSFNPAKLLQFVGDTLAQLGRVLNYAFLVLIMFVFMLAELASFPAKIRAVTNDPQAPLDRFSSIHENINRYMVLKTATSSATALVVGLFVWAIGVPYALLWGLVAFVLNFIPTIGSILAAIPPILLALIQEDLGLVSAGLVALGYLGVNVVIGSIIEPRFMGAHLNLAPLVVFVSMVFWGWILGPVGMLLSVPLTMTVKIALESSEQTRPIAVLLGTAPPDE